MEGVVRKRWTRLPVHPNPAGVVSATATGEHRIRNQALVGSNYYGNLAVALADSTAGCIASLDRLLAKGMPLCAVCRKEKKTF